ncbi:MAG: prepilin-type N-terminal cleavage/methylation domain-containing protein [Rickettsiales bacterium]
MSREKIVCKNNGFSLIELAIVIVIIALLISGIIASQSLIKSAEIKEVISEYDRYIKSIKEFQDKYNALPGDMSNAETIWGSDASCPNTTENTTPKTATCNGDGNGRIGSSATDGTLSVQTEWFRAWQQLANSGFIEGRFTGVKESATDGDAGIGINVPKSKLSIGAGWTIYYYLLTTTDTNLWGDNYGHVMAFGGDTTSVTNLPVISANDALLIDQKIDDGTPGGGTIRARRTASEANCTANDTSQSAATYNSGTVFERACSLLFILGF